MLISNSFYSKIFFLNIAKAGQSADFTYFNNFLASSELNKIPTE